jgi:hypothetical protein
MMSGREYRDTNVMTIDEFDVRLWELAEAIGRP